MTNSDNKPKRGRPKKKIQPQEVVDFHGCIYEEEKPKTLSCEIVENFDKKKLLESVFDLHLKIDEDEKKTDELYKAVLTLNTMINEFLDEFKKKK